MLEKKSKYFVVKTFPIYPDDVRNGLISPGLGENNNFRREKTKQFLGDPKYLSRCRSDPF